MIPCLIVSNIGDHNGIHGVNEKLPHVILRKTSNENFHGTKTVISNAIMFNHKTVNYVMSNMSSYIGNVFVDIKGEKYPCIPHIVISELDIVVYTFSLRSVDLYGEDLSTYTNRDIDYQGTSYVKSTTKKSLIKIGNATLDEINYKSNLFPRFHTYIINDKKTTTLIKKCNSSVIYDKNECPIGFRICQFNSMNKPMFILLPILMKFLEKMIDSDITCVKGIYLITDECQFKNETNDTINGLMIAKDSCKYQNGDKSYIFREHEIVIQVDGIAFNDTFQISCKTLIGMDISVDIMTYLMISTTLNETVKVTILKANDEPLTEANDNSGTDVITRDFTITGNEYNIIFKNRHTDNRHRLTWYEHEFIEMSEEYIRSLVKIGVSIPANILNEVNEAYDGSRNIVLIQTDKNKNKYSATNSILILKRIGKKRIKDLEDMFQTINSFNGHEYDYSIKSFTVCRNGIDDEKNRLKIQVV